jgi:hypothetical protein
MKEASLHNKLLLLKLLAVAMTGAALSACGGGEDAFGGGAAPVPVTYTIGGTITGLSGAGLVLLNNGGNGLMVTGASTSFTFSSVLSPGAAYAVTVQTQPVNQTCAVGSGSGTATTNITTVAITCATNTVTVGGTLTGLTGAGLVLQNNAGSNLAVAANASSFAFTAPINSGTGYAVTVLTEPAGQFCAVANGTGSASANVTNVALSCGTLTTTATVGGTISSLTSSGMVLRLNGANDYTVAANTTVFAFPTQLSSGATYSVTVLAQPSAPVSQTCTVASGSGTIVGASISNVQLNCTTDQISISGTITMSSGSLAAGLVLNKGTEDLAVSPGQAIFQFAGKNQNPSSYLVSIKSQPTGQTCNILRPYGTIHSTANISDILVSCVPVRTTTALNGTYSVVSDGVGVRGYLTFFSDGTYIFGLHEANAACGASNGNGVEYGVYNFNATTGALAISNTVVDTNGGCGLSDAGTGSTGTGFTKNGAGVIAGTVHDGAATYSMVLTPVTSVSGQLLGAWDVAGRLGVTIYNSDGTVFSSNTFAQQGVGANGLVAGIEDACLTGVTPATATGSYTPNFTGSCIIPHTPATLSAVDTNGSSGGISATGSAVVSYAVSADVLTLTVGALPAGTLSRIVAN